jgi:hypothetical protein
LFDLSGGGRIPLERFRVMLRDLAGLSDADMEEAITVATAGDASATDVDVDSFVKLLFSI